VATCSYDTTVKIWNISNPTNWTLISTYTNHTNYVFGLEWINEDTIASGGYDFTIKLWSISTGQTEITIKTSADVYSLKLLNNGVYMACGLSNGNIYIYDINNNGSLITTLSRHLATVFDLVQISDDLLASSSSDDTIRIWNLTTNLTKFILQGHTSDVYGLKLVSSDILASGSLDSTIKFWNITNGQLIRNLTGHIGNVQWSIDLLIDSQTLVSGSWDQTVKIWNLTTGECLSTFNTSLQIQTFTILKSSFATKIISREFSFCLTLFKSKYKF
jgi:WD40 repeat protein